MLPSGEEGTVIATQTRKNIIATRSGEHLHAYPQILIGLAGTTRCEFDRYTADVNRGHILMVPDSIRHGYTGLEHATELLALDLNPQEELVQSLETVCRMSFRDTLFSSPQSITLTDDTLPLLDFARRQLETNTPAPLAVNHQLVTLFLTLISQQYAGDHRPEAPQGLSVEVLNEVIDRRPSEPPSNQELARALYVSESHLYYLCRKQFGLTPQQYACSRRLKKARHCLQHSRMTITQIAQEYGFSDAAAFSRAYKRLFGYSPRHERSTGSSGQ
ncbi:AraC family transcriptional regulator [Zobellella sp. DQSA1]|uniref:helix-turn-helix transcriptional regulator n=1 Tax=Zobellella sp. DQSA1 TaxID=3342386 RepID=UPI0035BEC271